MVVEAHKVSRLVQERERSCSLHPYLRLTEVVVGLGSCAALRIRDAVRAVSGEA